MTPFPGRRLAYAFGLLDTGKFHEDTTRGPYLLDIGLRDAEAVDTAAQNVERVVYRTFGLFPQYTDDLFVRAGGSNFFAQAPGY